MKKPISILLALFITLGLLAAVPMAARADCVENTAPNPDVWTCDNSVGGADTDGVVTNNPDDTVVVVPGSTVSNPAMGGAAIQTGNGTVTNDGTVSENADSGTGILSLGTADVVNNSDGTISATGDQGTGIITLNGNVTNDGTILADDSTGTFGTGNVTGVLTDTGNVVNNGTISTSGAFSTGISTGGGNNTVTLGAGSSTTGTAAAVSTGAGDDTVVINNGAAVNGLIDGGALDTDTLTFTFFTQSQLSGYLPSGGSIMYNGNTYNWANFELLIGQLIQAAQNGHKHVYFRNKEIHARGIGSSKLTGINIYAEPGKIAFVPFSALPLIPFGGGVRFQLLNPENWFAVVVNHGPYENNVERNLYQVFIYDGSGALVSDEQSFVH